MPEIRERRVDVIVARDRRPKDVAGIDNGEVYLLLVSFSEIPRSLLSEPLGQQIRTTSERSVHVPLESENMSRKSPYLG